MTADRLHPSKYFLLITPNDLSDLPTKVRGISFGGAGDLAILDEDGNPQIISGLAAGIIHPIATTRVLASGTTATNIVVYW